MKESTKEKSLIQVNENSIFYKIKTFFKNLFHKNDINNITNIQENNDVKIENQKSTFMNEIQKIENEETKLLKLQKQYRDGEIQEKDLTQEQINSLCSLYDMQIDKLKKSNEKRKQKLAEYRKKQTE